MKKLSSKGQIHPFFSVLVLGLISVPMAFYGMYLYIAPSLPDMSSLQKAPLEQPLRIYTKDHVLISEFGDRLSLPVQYPNIPQDMIHAFLAAEDSAFFEHSGISFKGLGRAVTESISGSAQTGGSTITMQVAKNYYLSSERTLRRKLTEIFLARKIEQSLSKQDIFTLYVNKIFLGKNAYGIQAAAKIYYGKTLNQLSLAEKAMIAGLPKAPSKYNPVANPERALERRNWIIGRMLQLGYINQTQYETAITEPIQLKLYTHRTEEKYPYLAELVRKELVDSFGEKIMNSGFKVYTTVDSHRQEIAEMAVQNGLEEYDRRHGWRGAEAHNKPLSNFNSFANMWPAKVLKVNSTSFEAELKDGHKVTVYWEGMNWVRLYQNADNPGPAASRPSQIVKVNDIVRLRPNQQKTAWSLVQVPRAQGQLVALNPNSGALEAIVGGFSFYQSKFNRAVQGWRQPGSTIKPFIYALALEQGMTPYSIVNDAPISIGRWSPHNSDGRYLGPIPLRRALYLSRNTVSVRLLQTVGIQRTRQFLMNLGLHDKQIPNNFTIALGTPQTLPIQMATGYAVFANGGYRIQPYVIEEITDAKDKQIFKANPAYACLPCIQRPSQQNLVDPQSASSSDQAATRASPQRPAASIGQYRKAQRVLKSSSAYDMANILRDVIQHGTGRAALRLGRSDLGGKTGTTNDAKDAWFAGFNGSLVAIAWVGFDSPSSLGRHEYGGVAALPIWTDFMGGALQNKPYSWVELNDNETNVEHNSKLSNPELTQLQRHQQASPPVARPIYKAAPRVSTPAVMQQQDFQDLSDEESTPTETSRPSKDVTAAPKQREQAHPNSIF
jgi:penicillin-binding protein 1A